MMCSPHQWNWTLARLHISLHSHFCDYCENNITKPSKQELKVCNIVPPATFTLSHCFDWDCGWQTWIDMALWNGVLKWSLTYLTGREGPWGFYPHPSQVSGLPLLLGNGGEILHYSGITHLLPSWHLGVYQENVYASKPLKCQAPRWA